MHLQFIDMDATSMRFQNKQFYFAFDKGTLDPLQCGYYIKKLIKLLNHSFLLVTLLIKKEFQYHILRIISNKILKIEIFMKLKSNYLVRQNQLILRLKDEPLRYRLKDKDSFVQYINQIGITRRYI
ncbi:unnamed protein product [Paramecium sonneborni]|uniref:Uncharacterized protein n=1 Tax=Paramecium sonneborni TaxID=65129 RepID=A0A8S1R1J9_9CILI|nr:unnamed protein product [Paramecium sonneborni]